MPPTKYRADFPDRALGIMRNGASLCEVAADLGISEETIHAWKRDGKHKAFSEALAAGTALAQAWWERLGRAGAAGKVDVQPALWIFTMKNRFRWSDRTETEISGKGGAPIANAKPVYEFSGTTAESGSIKFLYRWNDDMRKDKGAFPPTLQSFSPL